MIKPKVEECRALVWSQDDWINDRRECILYITGDILQKDHVQCGIVHLPGIPLGGFCVWEGTATETYSDDGEDSEITYSKGEYRELTKEEWESLGNNRNPFE